MASIKLKGDTSGELTISAPAVAGTNTLTLPASTGTLLTTDGDGSSLTGISSYADSDALSLFNASGSTPVYAARAWVNFDGTGTVAIRASGNVSSITDNGTGIYTVNFTTAMPDADYSVGLAGGNSTSNTNVASLGGNAQAPNLLTTSVDIICSNIGGTVNDLPYITVSIFR